MSVPTYTHSQATLLEYTLHDGQQVYVSGGCVVERWTQRTLVKNSDETADWLLTNALLTNEQREWIEDHGRYVFPSQGVTPMAKFQIQRMKA